MKPLLDYCRVAPMAQGAFGDDLVLQEGDAAQWSVGITRQTIQRLLASDHKDKGDLIALWMFYAYTARWQGVNQPRCTTGYAAHGLGWTDRRVMKAKKALIEMGLVKDAVRRDEGGKVVGWFIRVFHLAKRIHPDDFPQGGEMHPKCSRSLSLNAERKKSKGSKGTSPHGDVNFPAEWKPDERSKEQKLATIRTPRNYPHETEFNAALVEMGCDQIASGKRGDLYRQLCLDKWHRWTGRKWEKIRDWRLYVISLDTKMEEATERMAPRW